MSTKKATLPAMEPSWPDAAELTASARIRALEAAVCELAGQLQGSIMADDRFAARYPALSAYALRFRQEEAEALRAHAAAQPVTAPSPDRYKPIFSS